MSADYSEGNRQRKYREKIRVPTVYSGGFERTLREFGPPEGMGAPPPPSQVSCQHLLISAADIVPDMSRRVEWCSLPPLPYLPPHLSQMGHLQHLPLPHLAALQLHAACQPKPQIFTDCKTGSVHLVSMSGAETEGRRPRGEKRPTPEGHKDDKYFERRKRNNQAAKKSRDARKFREDQIALRAMLLEQENRLLRAQLDALREEARTLLLR